MARVEKMIIQGIRSFGPEEDDEQMIRFYSPLTLILGQNGCGKTTIIEALKYAITGDMPPGCKQGQSFVHDPKIARLPEVRGRVQLKITDIKGAELAVTRSVQATQKLKNTVFKTLDSTITRKGPKGEPVQASSRCVEVDAEMCLSMGVTKAMINNVILCHQEDSNWPLDEGKKLKERFDAIFEATKYNKCLEHIRKLKASLQQEVKNLQEYALVHLKNNKEAAQRHEDELRDYENRISVAQDQIDKFEEKRAPIEQRLTEIHARESDIVGLMTERENKKTQINSLREQKQDLRRNISELFKGSVSELKEAIESFHSQLKEKDMELSNVEKKLNSTRREENNIGEQISNEQRKIGQLQTEEDQQQKWIKSRNSGLKSLAIELGLEEPVLSSTLQVEKEMELVEQKVQESVEGLEKLQHDLESDEVRLQSKVDSLRDEKVKLEQEISMKTGLVRSKREEMRKIRKDIEEVEKSAGRLLEVERELTEVKNNLDKTVKEVDAEELQKSIQTSQEKLKGLKNRLDVVYEEVNQLQLYSSVQTEINVQKEARATKEAELRRLKNKNADTIRHLIGSFPESGLKDELKKCLENLAMTIRDQNNQLSACQRDVTRLEVNRRNKKEQLESRERELKEFQDQVYDQCGQRDLEDVIADLADRIQELRDQKGTLTSQEHLFRRYVQKLQEQDPCCPLCHRNFNNTDEAAELISELNNEVRNVPARLRANNEKLERLVKEYDNLLQLRPTNKQIVNMKEEIIPKLKEELSTVEKNLEEQRRKIETLQNDLMGPQADEDMAKSIQSDVVLMDQCQVELRRLDREVEKIQARLPAGASSRSLEEAIQEQDKLRAESTAIQQTIDLAKEKLNTHERKLQKIRERKNELVEEQLKIQGGAQQLKQAEERLIELQSTEALMEEEIDELKTKLSTARTNFNDTTNSWNELRKKNRMRLDRERNTVLDIQKRYDEVRKWHVAILDYERRGVSDKLVACRENFKRLSEERDKVRERQKEQSAQIDTLKSYLTGQQVRQRELEDNLKLLELQAKEVDLSERVDQLNTRIGGLNFESLLSEKKKLQAENDKIAMEKAQSVGRIVELRQKVASLRRELSDEMYQEAARKYKEKLREVKVKEMAISDLNHYYKAMDWAMMHFHKERMKVINSMIHDLWQDIYRGNDIDNIQIRTNESESGDTKKRRTYDYKVVQIKNDVELEMRNRCSAGQKVLASLIIRIALAEALSDHCSILALDEPTTNLDHENIKSLARALAEIVNSRMVNKGFQLIVITHDEDFLQRLTRVDKLQYYFRVKRNDQGKSVIDKIAVER
ncbi:DNA repair protein RAD50 [Anabrus simplex]|uniref:DNA repair protein RAD50 n=1 Tax=Anabrus simplex TaxID=316456 RepID=UPI0035A291C5